MSVSIKKVHMNLAIVLVSNSSFSLMTMKTKMLTVIIFDAKVHNLNSALHILSYFFSFESRLIPCLLYVVRWVVGLIQVVIWMTNDFFYFWKKPCLLFLISMSLTTVFTIHDDDLRQSNGTHLVLQMIHSVIHWLLFFSKVSFLSNIFNIFDLIYLIYLILNVVFQAATCSTASFMCVWSKVCFSIAA